MNTGRIILLTGLIAVAIMGVAGMAPAQSTAASPSLEADKRVTLQFKDVPIGNAIAILFEGINHIVEPGVTGSVTLVLNEVPFTDALQALLKASGLTARKENGIYYVGPRKELPTDAAQLNEVVPQEVEVERTKIPEKVFIGFADVQEIGTYLNAQIGSSQRNGMGGGMGGGMMGGGMMGGGMMGGGMGGGMMGGGMMGGGMGGGMMGGGMGGGMMGGGMGGGMMGGGMGGGMGGRW